MLFGKGAHGIALANGMVLSELLDTLVKRDVLSRADVEGVLTRSLDSLAQKGAVPSFIEAMTIVKELLNRVQKVNV